MRKRFLGGVESFVGKIRAAVAPTPLRRDLTSRRHQVFYGDTQDGRRTSSTGPEYALLSSFVIYRLGKTITGNTVL